MATTNGTLLIEPTKNLDTGPPMWIAAYAVSFNKVNTL